MRVFHFIFYINIALVFSRVDIDSCHKTQVLKFCLKNFLKTFIECSKSVNKDSLCFKSKCVLLIGCDKPALRDSDKATYITPSILTAFSRTAAPSYMPFATSTVNARLNISAPFKPAYSRALSPVRRGTAITSTADRPLDLLSVTESTDFLTFVSASLPSYGQENTVSLTKSILLNSPAADLVTQTPIAPVTPATVDSTHAIAIPTSSPTLNFDESIPDSEKIISVDTHTDYELVDDLKKILLVDANKIVNFTSNIFSKVDFSATGVSTYKWTVPLVFFIVLCAVLGLVLFPKIKNRFFITRSYSIRRVNRNGPVNVYRALNEATNYNARVDVSMEAIELSDM